MKVYRLENAERFGPYTTESASRLGHDAGSSRTRPTHFEDGIEDTPWTYGDGRHGFESLQKLECWFPYDERVDFSQDSEGWRVSIYEVPNDPSDIRLGFCQVVYRAAEARLVGELDVVTLEPIRQAA